jgi:NAD(P)-dependent dehydrogenase (short-subunit alcohol dehydrogenase family)
LDQLTRMMALELGPHNIRVNSVHPTVTLTPMGEMAWSDPAKSGPVLARIPLGHFAQPVDVAQAIAYLLGDQARMIHGALLPLDGGFLVS